MVFYGTTLIPLDEGLRAAELGILSPFYRDNVAFDRSERRIAQLLKLQMERGLDWEYFLEPSKSLFIDNKPEEKEVVRQEFEQVGLNINYIYGIQYLGAYLGAREELKEWVQPKVEAWAHGVRTLAKTSNQYPQLAYSGLGMSLQI